MREIERALSGLYDAREKEDIAMANVLNVIEAKIGRKAFDESYDDIDFRISRLYYDWSLEDVYGEIMDCING